MRGTGMGTRRLRPRIGGLRRPRAESCLRGRGAGIVVLVLGRRVGGGVRVGTGFEDAERNAGGNVSF